MQSRNMLPMYVISFGRTCRTHSEEIIISKHKMIGPRVGVDVCNVIFFVIMLIRARVASIRVVRQSLSSVPEKAIPAEIVVPKYNDILQDPEKRKTLTLEEKERLSTYKAQRTAKLTRYTGYD